MCCLVQHAYSHRDFCWVDPSAKPDIPPRLRANRKIMLFCCISIRQHTTMLMKPGNNHALITVVCKNIPQLLMPWNNMWKGKKGSKAWHIWGQSFIGKPEVPESDLWGCARVADGTALIPCLTTLPEAAEVCQELLKCGCKKSCTKRCKCVKANLPCKQLCFCSAQCVRDYSI